MGCWKMKEPQPGTVFACLNKRLVAPEFCPNQILYVRHYGRIQIQFRLCTVLHCRLSFGTNTGTSAFAEIKTPRIMISDQPLPCISTAKERLEPKPQNTISLTFHGVEVVLVADSTERGALSLCADANGNFSSIQLSTFSGTLFLRPIHSSRTQDVAHASTTGLVEDDASSPSPMDTSSTQQEQQQQVLGIQKQGKKNTTLNQRQLSFAPQTNKAVDKSTASQTKKRVAEPMTVPVAPKKTLFNNKADITKASTASSVVVAAVSSSSSSPSDTLLTELPVKNCVDSHTAVETGKILAVEAAEPFRTSLEIIPACSQLSVSSVSVRPISVSSGTQNTDLPPPRWGHTLTRLSQDRLLLYGGQTVQNHAFIQTLADVHMFDMKNQTWKAHSDCLTTGRTWHTATFLPGVDLLVVYGGERFHEKTKKMTPCDDIMVLDTEIMLWYPPSVSGSIPSGRSGHSANLLTFGQRNHNIVIFGGVKGNKWSNSLAVLDTKVWRWRLPKVSGQPPLARSYHTSTCIRTTQGNGEDESSYMLVIFGGNNDLKSFNSVHVLHVHDDVLNDSEWTWSHPTVSGTPPSPRTGHSATLMQDQKTIMIYGGWDPCADEDDGVNQTKKGSRNTEKSENDDVIFGDSFLLCTETWTWRQGPTPTFWDLRDGCENKDSTRTGHDAVLINNIVDGSQNIVAFGGRTPNDSFANDFQFFKD